ncbi:MAG: Flp family type IVb pilin [Micromonosporaceae bacterium]|jgi:pilus assembly protein Flp/PilA
MTRLVAMWKARLAGRDRGATAVEYGLIVALIAAVIVTVVWLLGGNIQQAFQTVNNCVQVPSGCGGSGGGGGS